MMEYFGAVEYGGCGGIGPYFVLPAGIVMNSIVVVSVVVVVFAVGGGGGSARAMARGLVFPIAKHFNFATEGGIFELNGGEVGSIADFLGSE